MAAVAEKTAFAAPPLRPHAARPVIDTSVRDRVSAEEWEARTELAALYRLVDHFRWTDTIYTHISLRVPGELSFLINPFGLLYEEVTASSLVKIDVQGNILDDPLGLGINLAGFLVHGAVHAARDDVHCVLHTHTRAGIAVSAQEDGLLPISQHASALIGRIAYHDFEGIAIRPDERAGLVADLGDKPIMILRNHGLLVAESCAADAFRTIDILERACEIQIAALSGGVPVRRITQQSIDNSQNAVATAPVGPCRVWAAMLRLLERVAPDYAN